MDAKEIEQLLRRKKIVPGDRIRVVAGGLTTEGILVPKGDADDPRCLAIKLDSGYNVGIALEKGATVEKVAAGKAGKALGATSKSLLNLHFDPAKPLVSMVACGGTIASRVDYRTGGVYAAQEPREFLHNVPELADSINLATITKPVTRMSEDMGHQDWIEIAKAVHRELKKAEGVIVTHGTDTLHYTAAALSFFLRTPGKPVVLVGAQVSSDRGSSDAGMNLVCAARLVVADLAEVGTCMHGSVNDDYCFFIRGTKVRKMHTVRRDAFRPINDLPLAKVFPEGKVEKLQPCRSRSNQEPALDAAFDPRVALVKVHPSSDPGVLEYHRGKGVRGFVIEGTGLGHVPTAAARSWIPAIKEAVKDGVPVVVTSQTIYGRVNPNVYTNLRVLYREAGAIPGEDMLSEVAFVKLGHVLAKAKDQDEVRRLMLTNLAGEITDRSLPQTFLY
ncbi:MAG: Glu-tRNA(Gln) amidotransferase subunit GatD [Candidatus Aenigmarchaeota archaeon]|nr:Glu-tRNA(Gln) amidotransferase subunit GatD [Candidatus Aenigmarchaeota archaeon]